MAQSWLAHIHTHTVLLRLNGQEEDAIAVMWRNSVSEEVIQAAMPCIKRALDRSPEMNQETTVMKTIRAEKRG
eukprot:1158798-Pelagomonas_calceolata.AAC.2